MACYTGLNGKKYITEDNCFARGGEGEIYKIRGEKNLVAKIFKTGKNTETRRRKLTAIISATEDAEDNQWVIWPVDVLSDNGKFAGYVMPVLEGGTALNNIYATDSSLTLKEKIHVARNLCLAVNSVHQMGQVIGDLNPNNIMVNTETLNLRLIDADSYHFQEGSRTYRCEVGVDVLYPKELQEKFSGGKTPATADLPTFTSHTDEFALAAHIFALLMNGAHPYSSAVNNIGRLTQPMPSVAVPQPVEAIRSGFFPYADRKAGLTTPSYAPDYAYCPDEIRELFLRAFKEGHTAPSARPDAREWYNALVRMENSLVHCRQNHEHMYPSGTVQCPWCELEGRGACAEKPSAERKTAAGQKAASSGKQRSSGSAPQSRPVTATPQRAKANEYINNGNTAKANSYSASSNAVKTAGRKNLRLSTGEKVLIALLALYSGICAFLTVCLPTYYEIVNSYFGLGLFLWGGIIALTAVSFGTAETASEYSEDMLMIWLCVALTMFNIAYTYYSLMYVSIFVWMAGFLVSVLICVMMITCEEMCHRAGANAIRMLSACVSPVIGVVGAFCSIEMDLYQPLGGYYFTLMAAGTVAFGAVIASLWYATE